MLQVKNVCKKYKTGDLVQIALKDVSVNLRDNEFVAILGPSGSGKTTLLNIIGGLDRYDSGDLVINNVSTKKYKDKNWDSYRNHTVGFVFQSYNLIPHQTILANVQLALTISGVKGKKATQKALEALDKVGLKEQAHKKPNQLSGGQMQRVAIARALVNDPKILLADEPTGALDTQTSIQVMELLKEVAKDRLVVMVTHNPELAEEYANRIIRLKDGVILSDTNPYIVENVEAKHKDLGRSSMSLFTSFGLSFNNLLTKITRTLLTAFAGSIGIIGIALILSLSTGFQNYVDKIQEDTMTSYPLQINSETTDMFSAILSIQSQNSNVQDGETLTEMQYISSMFSALGTNDLTSLKKHFENTENEYANDVKEIKYSYSVSPLIYGRDVTGKLVQLNPSTALSSIYSGAMSSAISMMSTSSGVFNEGTIDPDNYEVLKGRYPENYDELAIVLSDKNKISDLLLYSLGYKENAKLKTLITSVMTGEEIELDGEQMVLTYDDLLNLELKLINPSDLYKYNMKYETYEDMSADQEYLEDVYASSKSLKVVGLLWSENGNGNGVIFSPSLVQEVIKEASTSPIVLKQLNNKDVDVFSGKRFDEPDEDKGLDFNDMISIDQDAISNAFKINADVSKLNVDADKIESSIKSIGPNMPSTMNQMIGLITPLYNGVASGVVSAYEAAFTKVANTVNGCPLNIDQDTLVVTEWTNGGVSGCNIIPEIEDDYATMKTVNIAALATDPENALVDIVVYKDKFTKNLITDIDAGPLHLDITSDNVFNMLFDNVYNVLASSAPQVKDIITKESVKASALDAAKNYYDGLDHTPGIMVKTHDLLANPTDTLKTSSVLVALSKDTNVKAICLDAASASAMTLAAPVVMENVVGAYSSIKDLFSGDIMTIDTDAFAKAFNFDLNEDEVSRLMVSMMTKDSASYRSNLIKLGYQDVDDPTSISIYFKDFEGKGRFIDYLKQYNENVDEEQKISYTDITGLLMSSVETIINSVTYVLIAFVSISLIVSSIMIGIITYISVLERTKEIGILRAIGASKRNISSIFNCETFIIGLISGLIGIGITILANIPINNIIHKVTDNYNINAVLPKTGAVVLVILSVVLTLIGGLIPSRAASKKDPVIALRSE